MDFQIDATAVGRRLKFLNAIDKHSPPLMPIRVGRCCKAKDLMAVLRKLTSLYPAPVKRTTILNVLIDNPKPAFLCQPRMGIAKQER
mgnify:CR=1 FL=1